MMGKHFYVADWLVWLLVLGLVYSVVKVGEVERQMGQVSQEVKEQKPPEVVRSMHRITLLSSSIDQGYEDWGGPDPYIMVFVDGEKTFETTHIGDTFYVDWGYYSEEIMWRKVVKEGEVISSSRIDVWLMDEDVGEDDVVAHWEVNDLSELKKLSTDGSWVKFKVKKLKEKGRLKY